MKKVNRVIIYVLSFLILSSLVSAVSFSLNSVLGPLSGNALANFYLRYFAFIDAVIYLILFLSLAQLVFMKVYKDNVKEAKMIAVAIALALTFAMTMLEMRTGFYLGELAPVALIIFLCVIAILLFNLFQGLFNGSNGKTVSAALTYLIIYGLLNVPFNALSRWIEQNVSLLSAVLAIAAIVSFIYLVIELFKAIGLGGGSSTTTGPAGPQGPTGPQGPPGVTPTPPQPTPPVTPQPTYPNDLRDIINNGYIDSVNNLNAAYGQYANIFNTIIQLHHNALTPPNPEPGINEWTALLNARDALTQAEIQANTILTSIRTHTGYANLNAADVGTLTNIMNIHANINRSTIDYELLARNAYNAATVPPAIPQP